MEHLANRQQAFASALLNSDLPAPKGLVGPDGKQSERRFSVYRNNVFVGLTEALRAGFPCCTKLVGEEFFMAMARAFAAAHPPKTPVLLHYGAEFPDFIASFPPAEPLPYLADVARIERAATEAYHERDETALLPCALAGVPPEQALFLRLKLHPSVRLLRSPFPAFTIWQMNTADGTPAPVDLAKCQDTLVLRPEAWVDVRQMHQTSHDFLAALAHGMTLAQALKAALAADPGFDLSENLRALIQMGAFVDFTLGAGEIHHE